MNSNQGRSAPWLAAVTSLLFLLIFCFLPSCSSSSSISSPPPSPLLYSTHPTSPSLTAPTPPRTLPFPSHKKEGLWVSQGSKDSITSGPAAPAQDGRTAGLFLHLFIPFLLIYSFPFHAFIQKAFLNTHKGPWLGRPWG